MTANAFVRGLFVFLVAAATTAHGADLFTKQKKRYPIGPHVMSVVVADLNGDGLPEIVTADRGGLADPREERPAHDQLSYLEAMGNLEYRAHPQLRSGFGPYKIVAANIDALKDLDLVVVNFMATRNRDLTLLRNVGNHIFEPYYFSVADEDIRYEQLRDGDDVPIFTAPGLTSLAVADINGDGYRDAVTTGWSSDILAVFPGALEGYFAAPILIPARGGPRDVAVRDFDGDGKPDLATVMYGTHEVALWKGNGDGTFIEATRFPSRGRLPQAIRIADMNGDGIADLIAAHCHADDSIVIFFGDGKFSFSVSQEIVLGAVRQAVEHEIRDIVVDDFDGDGRQDIAAACFLSSQVVLLRNTKSENARSVLSFTKDTYTFDDGKPRALAPGDFNGDGKLDLAVGLWEANAVALLLNRP